MSKITELWPQLDESNGHAEEMPKAVVILGQAYPIYSWRDMLRRTVDVAATLCGDDFGQQVAVKWPAYFKREAAGEGWYKLPNGWSVYVNNNGATNRRLCATVIAGAGIPEEEFRIEYW